MTDTILIPFKQQDHVEELIPYLEFVARPETQVVFLVENHEMLYPWWSAYDVSAFHRLQGRLQRTIARQRQSFSAEARISCVRRVLQAKGATVHLEFCSSFRSAIHSYRDGDAKTMILVCRKFRYLSRFPATMRRAFKRFRVEPAPPMLLLRPDRKF